jgi:hypothetical protein
LNQIAKYSAVIVIAVLASAITSYEVTSNLEMIAQNPQLPQANNDPIETRVNLTISRVYIANPNSASYIEVAFGKAVHNLTIVYRYTALNGTTFISSVDYGNYEPTWNTGDTISPGDIPSLRFRIPDDIILVSSSVKMYYAGEGGGYAWDIFPQVEAIEAYGYA